MSTALTTSIVSPFDRTKARYVAQEEALEKLVKSTEFQAHFKVWLDTTLAEIEAQYTKCHHSLHELQETVRIDDGMYWTAKTLTQHCNISVEERRLRRLSEETAEHSSWPELIRLKATLRQLHHRSASQPDQQEFLSRVEAELAVARFTPKELSNIAHSLEVKLLGDVEIQTAANEVLRRQQLLTSKLPLIDECENELEASLMNGNMALAESVSYKQLDIHEELLSIVMQQYPVITRLHDDTEEFKRRRRWAIFRLANKDIRSVVEGKLRAMEACMDDSRKIAEQVENYSRDDAYQRKRYESDLEESQSFLQSNHEQQQAVWNRVMEIYAELCSCQEELGRLAQARRREIDRRLLVEDREASRRCGHEAFLKQARAFVALLEKGQENATRAASCARALNDFVLDGCDSLTDKFDRQHQQLDHMLHALQNAHFKRYCDFHLSAGRLKYRLDRRLETFLQRLDDLKAKQFLASETFDPVAIRYAEERDDIERHKKTLIGEINALKHRMEKQDADAESLLRAFADRGVPFVHPKAIVEKVNFDRKDRVLEYREMQRPEKSRWEAALEDEQAAHETLKAIKDQTVKAKESDKLKTPRAPLGASPATAQQYYRVKAIVERPTTLHSSTTTSVSQGVTVSESSRNVLGASASLKSSANAALKDKSTPAAAAASGPPVGTYARLQPGSTVRALFSYRPQQPDELALEKGDIVICVGPASEDGWYQGVVNQKTGVFPVNYITLAGGSSSTD